MEMVDIERKFTQLDSDVRDIHGILEGIVGTQEIHGARLDRISRRLHEHTFVLKRHGQLLGDLSDRLDLVDGKIDTVAGHLDGKIDTVADQLDGKIDTVADQLDGKIDTVAGHLDGKIDTVAGHLDGKIETMTDQLDGKIDTVIDLIRAGQAGAGGTA